MAESEDRTQAPSKLRHQQARERGQVAQSPELTTAAALIAASIAMGIVGDSLSASLLALVRGPWTTGLAVSIDPGGLVYHLRSTAMGVLGPVAMVFLAIVAAAVAAHAAQVGLLWSPALLAPNPERLFGGGAGLGARIGRSLWTFARMVVVLVVAVWAIRSRVDDLATVGRLEPASIARAWIDAAIGTLRTMAIAALALGLVDYTLQRRRFEGMLRLTPDEAREDRKATDGDPALRSRRLRMARAWRGDAPELLVGATLVVAGDRGLVVILGGGPPPRRVSIRSAADGPTGRTLRRSAESSRLTILDDPALATRLGRLAARSDQPIPADLLLDLAGAWPGA